MNKKIDMKFDLFIKLLEKCMENDIFPDEVIFLPLTDDEWKIIFTERRIELIKAITEKKPKSVNELVKLLKRHQEAVSRDLRYLEKIGMIKIETKGKNRVPSINKKLIITPLLMPVKAKQ